MTPSPAFDLSDALSPLHTAREGLYELADLAPHWCVPLHALTSHLTHVELMLGRRTTQPEDARRAIHDVARSALTSLDTLSTTAPLDRTPLDTQLNCCRAVFHHLVELAARPASSTAA